jgi:hypothetical protein
MSAAQAVLVVAAAVIAVAAGCRSTWSPCGLSMLSTITPIGERGRGNRYGITATWFVVGALLGGATLGAVMAGFAAMVGLLHLGPVTLDVSAAVVLAVAGASDAGIGWHLPYHRRQVNERWLDQFRPWVYGVGFGWQIGTGLATYVMTAAVYALIALSALTGQPLAALLIGSLFGLVRGFGVLLGRRITDPDALLRFHQWFDRLGPRVRLGTIATDMAAAVTLAGLAWPPAAAVAVGALALCAAAIHADVRRVRVVRADRDPTPPEPVAGPVTVTGRH